jgi:plasmid maintenance system antidote protein VapI
MAVKKRTIVEQLRQAIADSGQSEYAIAKGSGVSQSVVNRFVSGERGISLETAAKLCDYLGLDLTSCR